MLVKLAFYGYSYLLAWELIFKITSRLTTWLNWLFEVSRIVILDVGNKFPTETRNGDWNSPIRWCGFIIIENRMRDRTSSTFEIIIMSKRRRREGTTLNCGASYSRYLFLACSLPLWRRIQKWEAYRSYPAFLDPISALITSQTTTDSSECKS